jgi:phospholipid/cholesterol/gamma-HCH transport system permease protein
MIASIGRRVNERFREFSYASGFFFQMLKGSLSFFKREQIGFKVLTMQILFTGIEALSIIVLIGLALGAVIIIEGFSILPQLGQGAVIYQILIIVITRELGPMLTAFIIIARSSTAIATELGNMIISTRLRPSSP